MPILQVNKKRRNKDKTWFWVKKKNWIAETNATTNYRLKTNKNSG